MHDYSKAAPRPTPETRPYWDGLKEGRLMLQRSKSTGQAYFPPRPFFPGDPSQEVEWFEASGRGKLYTYVINHRPPPGYEAPFAIAVVELEEGPRLATNIVDCPQTPDALQLDMELELVPHRVDEETWLPLFRPVNGGGTDA
ncbi:MAG: Zn-ribbon domain-containing OB-fold protein [Dehalococcoidia bacterium]